MNNKSVSDKRYKKYDYYIKQPFEMVELKLNKIFSENPHLINSRDRINNHPLIRKFSNIPFNIQ